MREVVRSNTFKLDLKRCLKQGRKIEDFERVLTLLLSDAELPSKYCDHPLIGNWKGWRDLHIYPDWLLIYKIEGGTLYLAAMDRMQSYLARKIAYEVFRLGKCAFSSNVVSYELANTRHV